MYFAQMCRYIDITRDDYFKDMKQHEKDIKILGSILGHSKILRFVYLLTEFVFCFCVLNSNKKNQILI